MIPSRSLKRRCIRPPLENLSPSTNDLLPPHESVDVRQLLAFLEACTGAARFYAEQDQWRCIELRLRCQQLREGRFLVLREGAVTLVCEETRNFLIALTALDGWAARILLADTQASQEQLEAHERAAGSQWRITARAEEFAVS